jgi:hypothetical protein
METKRHVLDLFLNTNNPVISKIFGYNNNIMMGNCNCINYVTLYNTKGPINLKDLLTKAALTPTTSNDATRMVTRH